MQCSWLLRSSQTRHADRGGYLLICTCADADMRRRTWPFLSATNAKFVCVQSCVHTASRSGAERASLASTRIMECRSFQRCCHTNSRDSDSEQGTHLGVKI